MGTVWRVLLFMEMLWQNFSEDCLRFSWRKHAKPYYQTICILILPSSLIFTHIN